MQYLLLSRHGNTFAPTDKIVWVGAHNDLPLVESGIKQADTLGQALLDSCLIPQTIYTGPLKRAFIYAQIIRDKLSLDIPLQIDSRLQEIDYGKWSGLCDQEIREQFGDDELDQWRNKGIWPESFNSSEKEIIAQVFSFVDDIIIKQPAKRLTLAVTSNGCLKYFLQLVMNTQNKPNKWKVSTGQTCLLAFINSTWEIVAWNESPLSVCTRLKTEFKALARIT
jgi:broad specificity phosphatase PhoE